MSKIRKKHGKIRKKNGRFYLAFCIFSPSIISDDWLILPNQRTHTTLSNEHNENIWFECSRVFSSFEILTVQKNYVLIIGRQAINDLISDTNYFMVSSPQVAFSGWECILYVVYKSMLPFAISWLSYHPWPPRPPARPPARPPLGTLALHRRGPLPRPFFHITKLFNRPRAGEICLTDTELWLRLPELPVPKPRNKFLALFILIGLRLYSKMQWHA
jgi:hypothetical protein